MLYIFVHLLKDSMEAVVRHHAASLQILATVVMLRFISLAIAGSEWPAALSSFTFPRSGA
jgi:hypothetical protein